MRDLIKNNQTNVIIIKQKSPLKRGKEKKYCIKLHDVLNAEHEEITTVPEI